MFRFAPLLLPFVLAAPLAAEPTIISAREAFSAARDGDLILIDIRSPGEWAQTGVAQGAVALTMHSQDFAREITTLLNAQKGKKVGLICATGGRTEYVTSILAQNGFPAVIDVSEGMMGNARGPGWIARGLPLMTAKDAQEAYARLTSKP
ncbi:MAG: rhodanese-like domain-containing protein [Planktotalea sp.]|uniref:rhodanese-like domain-containing protein n=1 Tax=Planktotalea sp. TaxID=2029877 RepID=UPI003C7129C4